MLWFTEYQLMIRLIHLVYEERKGDRKKWMVGNVLALRWQNKYTTRHLLSDNNLVQCR
jgi:hypothetical protein